MNPKILEIYYKQHKKRQKEKNQEIDTVAWLQGQYICAAIAANFSKSKYPKQPFSLKEEETQEKVSDAEKFEMWAMSFNKYSKTD